MSVNHDICLHFNIPPTGTPANSSMKRLSVQPGSMFDMYIRQERVNETI